jgi:hypothetical protein
MISKGILSFSALSIALWIYSDVTGWIGASIVIFRIEENAANGRRIVRAQIDMNFFTLISL